MSPETNGEQNIRSQVDEIFTDTTDLSVRRRVKIASFVLLDTMLDLQNAKNKQMEAFEAFTKSTGPTTHQVVQVFGIYPVFVPEQMVTKSHPEFETEFTDIEKAEMAVNATLQEVQAVYGLSPRQAKRAQRITKRKIS